MKKLLALLAVLVMMFSMTACGGGGGGADNDIEITGTEVTFNEISFTVPDGWKVMDENSYASTGYVTVAEESSIDEASNHANVYVEFHQYTANADEGSWDYIVGTKEKYWAEDTYDETNLEEMTFGDVTYSGTRVMDYVGTAGLDYKYYIQSGKYLYEIRSLTYNDYETEDNQAAIKMILASFKIAE